MEIFTTGISIIKNIILLIGGSMCAVGAIQFFQGLGENGAADKKTGISLFVGGAGIVMIALNLIPMLGNIG